MNRINKVFKKLGKKNSKALIAFITCGFPDLKTTEKLVYYLEESGVDIIELGIPFSDPIADGPTIQYSSQKALAKGVTLNKILKLVKSLRKKTNIPLAIMSYLNPIYNYGIEKFMKYSAECGIDGLIIPDIIPEEGKTLEHLAKKSKINIIYLLTPTSPPERRRMIFKHSSGFIYVVSVTGTTGTRKQLPVELKKFLSAIRKETNKPLALGFGISRPEQINEVKKYIDGIIIGSALIKLIDSCSKKQLKNKLTKFLSPWRTK